VRDLEKAIPYLEKSLDWYAKLVKLTKDTYLYANSMQTGQRTIPISGANGKNKTWKELLPYYQEELKHFKNNIALLKSEKREAPQVEKLQPTYVKIRNEELTTYKVGSGAQPFTDEAYSIKNVATELKGLKGYKMSMKQQQIDGVATNIQFENKEPVKLVVGFF